MRGAQSGSLSTRWIMNVLMWTKPERPFTPTQLDRSAYANNMQIGLLSVARLLPSGMALWFWEVRL
jgi:hypothetical protein